MNNHSNSSYVPSENGEGTGNNQDPTTPEVIPLVNDNNTEALTPPVVQDDSAGDVHRTSLQASIKSVNSNHMLKMIHKYNHQDHNCTCGTKD